MALIPKPQFPNVPQLPGVPQLKRSLQFPAGPPPILGAAIALGRLWQSLFTQPQWAIYRREEPQPQTNEDGIETVTVVAERNPVIVPDSFRTFGHHLENDVSDYPVQEGGFVNYNKVANPSETFVRMSKGGSVQQRTAFLKSIDAIVGTVDLYDILTPEKIYLSVNVLRFEIIREGARGAYFFAEVDLYFREIRTVTSTYSTTAVLTENAQDSSAAPVANVGTVQGQQQPATVTPESLGIPDAQP